MFRVQGAFSEHLHQAAQLPAHAMLMYSLTEVLADESLICWIPIVELFLSFMACNRQTSADHNCDLCRFNCNIHLSSHQGSLPCNFISSVLALNEVSPDISVSASIAS